MQMRTEEEKQMTLDWEPAEGRSKSRHLVEIRLQGGYQSQQENLHPPLASLPGSEDLTN